MFLFVWEESKDKEMERYADLINDEIVSLKDSIMYRNR